MCYLKKDSPQRSIGNVLFTRNARVASIYSFLNGRYNNER